MTENTLIYEYSFKKPVTVSFDPDHLKLSNEDESIVFEDFHSQDCCENVYADFSSFKYYVDSLSKIKISKVEVKAVEEMGLVFFFYEEDAWNLSNRIGVLVCCYNQQNGYYSSNLKLVIKNKEDDTEKRIDVSQVVFDNID